MARGFALALLASALLWCTSDHESLTPEQREAMRELVGTSPPSPRYPLDVVFDRRVKLRGYDLEQTDWRAGVPLKITWYWEVIAPPRPGSMLSTEVVDPVSGSAHILTAASDAQTLLPPEHWRAGRFVRDEQTLALPPGWTAPYAMVRARLHVGDDPAEEGATISIHTPRSASLPKTTPPQGVVRTKSPPRLDGALSDPVWAFAREGSGEAGWRLLWDSRFLYVGASVETPIERTGPSDGSRACLGGCVGISFTPDRGQSTVYTVEMSRRGDVRQTRYDLDAESATETPVTWGSRSRVSTQRSRDSARTVVEMAIPWQAFSLDGSAFAPPEPDDRWRVAIFGISESPAARRTRDFHVPGRFGILRFEGAPDDMQGSSTPIELPEGRMPASMRRSIDPAVRNSLLEKNAAEKNRIDAVRATGQEAHSLEPAEGGH